MLQPSLCDLGKLCFLLSCFSVLAILKIYNMLLLDVDCKFKITKPCGKVLDDANWITLTKLNVPFWKGQEIFKSSLAALHVQNHLIGMSLLW